MELYRGAYLIECETGGRPLYLPVLQEENQTLLLDCGTRRQAEKDIPEQLERLNVTPQWLIVTHPDGDHCGGAAHIRKCYTQVRVACGDADKDQIESPDCLFAFRRDAYRELHGLFVDSENADLIKNCLFGPVEVALTFVEGETLCLGPNRILEIWRLLGHRRGHLGLFDRRHRVLYYGDAIQGSGYKSFDGNSTLCPTYVYVDAYLQTIRCIEDSDAEMIVDCHWPVLRGKEQILRFCAESRSFVIAADHLVIQFVRKYPTLRDLCEQLSEQLGTWPKSVHLELANALSGHLNRGVELGMFNVDPEFRPLRYRFSEAKCMSNRLPDFQTTQERN
jgi:glyoxylase-like metal-dependent hydrolase (beta-lactamase superfamily II)